MYVDKLWFTMDAMTKEFGEQKEEVVSVVNFKQIKLLRRGKYE